MISAPPAQEGHFRLVLTDPSPRGSGAKKKHHLISSKKSVNSRGQGVWTNLRQWCVPTLLILFSSTHKPALTPLFSMVPLPTLPTLQNSPCHFTWSWPNQLMYAPTLTLLMDMTTCALVHLHTGLIMARGMHLNCAYSWSLGIFQAFSRFFLRLHHQILAEKCEPICI